MTSTTPNILIVMLDDVGFGTTSPFGGPVSMPTADRLAQGGLRYNQFHTTAICSSTRAALLTGRNHHSVNVGHVMNASTETRGYSAKMPREAATIAKILREQGFATGAFGKMHETPRSEITPVGPFERWPTQLLGFDKFYGFMGSSMNHWVPTLWDGTSPVDPASLQRPGYHLSEDLVDQAAAWIDLNRSLHPDRPFLCYLPFGATHAPFHVKQEWADRYAGAFDDGWDEHRRRILERQIADGIVPPDTELAPWPRTIERWDDLSPDEQRAAARLMEVYAGFAEHTDAQVGRLVDFLEERGELENTLIFYLVGDNGASAEGGRIGSVTGYYADSNGLPETSEQVIADLPRVGGHDTWPHFARGWAVTMDTPMQWVKQMASHYGGTRNGLIVHWPAGIESRGEIRDQWHHVIDIAPTILATIGLKEPTTVEGVVQTPIEGVDMAYSFDSPTAESTHHTQYFEIGGNRAIYHDGWVACAVHRDKVWDALGSEVREFEDDVWELYDTRQDFSQAHDLATEHPDKLAELQELFMTEAERYSVLPLDNRSKAARKTAEASRRPTSMRLVPPCERVPLEALPGTMSHSHVLRASVSTSAETDAEGVICAAGGVFAGWSLYVADGRLSYCSALGEAHRAVVAGPVTLGPGKHEVEARIEYVGPGLGGRINVVLVADGSEVARGTIARTVGYTLPAGEDFAIGRDPGTPVSHEYAMGDNAFQGTIHWVEIHSGEGIELTPEDLRPIELAVFD